MPISRELRRIEEAAAAQHGVTMWQYAILSVVDRRPGRNQAEVADVLGYSKNRIVGDLDHLERRGLLTRQPGADRRANILTVTVAGPAGDDRRPARDPPPRGRAPGAPPGDHPADVRRCAGTVQRAGALAPVNRRISRRSWASPGRRPAAHATGASNRVHDVRWRRRAASSDARPTSNLGLAPHVYGQQGWPL